MIEIIWEHYLSGSQDDTDSSINRYAANAEQIADIENYYSCKPPESYIKMLMKYAGMEPVNLCPTFPNGKQDTICCINHADRFNKAKMTYCIDFPTSALKEQGYSDLLCFAFYANVFYCLDYSQTKTDPPVVFIFRDYLPDDPDHKYVIANNFDEFLEKCTVEYIEDNE